MLSALWFVFLGLFGGFTFILIYSEKWEDLIKFSAFKRYMIGAVVGFLFNILHSEYSFPNSITCFVYGFSGTTLIEMLALRYERFRREPS